MYELKEFCSLILDVLFGVLHCHTQINNVLSAFAPFLYILIQEEKQIV